MLSLYEFAHDPGGSGPSSVCDLNPSKIRTYVRYFGHLLSLKIPKINTCAHTIPLPTVCTNSRFISLMVDFRKGRTITTHLNSYAYAQGVV